MITGDLVGRLRSPHAAAWRRSWRRELPVRMATVAPAVAALAVAGPHASAWGAGGWLTWVGVAAAAGYLVLAAQPGTVGSALATVPAAVTVLLLAASPLDTGLVVTESGLLLAYLVLLDRWEAPGGRWSRRLARQLPGLAMAAGLLLGGLLVAAGVAVAGSVAVAVVGMAAALGAAALTVRSGRFR